MEKEELFTQEQIDALVDKGNIVIRDSSKKTFHARQKDEIYYNTFCNKYKCFICQTSKDIQIHHLNEYAISQFIDTYEDFIKIPWLPLCKKHHRQMHQLPENINLQDD